MVEHKIERATTRVVPLYLNEPFTMTIGDMYLVDHVVVELEAGGQKGLGEVCSFPAFMGESTETILGILERYLIPVVTGASPFDMEWIQERLDRTVHGNSTAKSALDFALYDLQGKLLGRPAFQLLGGRFREGVLLTWVIGAKDARSTVAEAAAKWQEGYRVFKLKVGVDDRQDEEKVRGLREALPQAKIRIDANEGYRLDQALKVLPRLEAFDLELIEQPLKRWDLEGMATLCRKLATPIMADESAFSLEDLVQLIRHQAAHIVNIKVAKIGGLHKARKAAGLLQAAGIPCIVGNNFECGPGTAAGLHFGLATANVLYASDVAAGINLHRQQILAAGGITLRDGYMYPSGGSGLGVSIEP